MSSFLTSCGILTSLLLAVTAAAAQQVDAYRAMGLKPADVLNGTVLKSQVLPGPDKQLVALTTYFTGKKEKEQAINVRLDVFRQTGEDLEPVYSRDFGKENGGYVADGDLQLVDLDRDGLNEIIVSYRSFTDPLIEQRVGEVIVQDDGTFHSAWVHPIEYDATRAARNVPVERRDRYEREIDIANTLRTRGVTLFVQKKVIAVAGERLGEPKTVQETFPLRRDER